MGTTANRRRVTASRLLGNRRQGKASRANKAAEARGAPRDQDHSTVGHGRPKGQHPSSRRTVARLRTRASRTPGRVVRDSSTRGWVVSLDMEMRRSSLGLDQRPGNLVMEVRHSR